MSPWDPTALVALEPGGLGSESDSVILDASFNVHVPPFPHLLNGNNNGTHLGIVVRMK